MVDDLMRRAHALLADALEVAEHDRRTFVERACAGDEALFRRMESLLATIPRATDFLDAPVAIAPGRAGLEAVEETMALPKSIGSYRIERVVGVGGMATVYEAVQERPRRRVALKVMRFALVRTSAVRRFEFETEVLARLRHPGIAQILEAGVHQIAGRSVPYFAMEFIENARTIVEHCEERGLPIRGRIELFASVCDAVHHGHQHGVIHRDLKPANILVDEAGRAKVIDFGIARSTEHGREAITEHGDLGQIVGTLDHMSPEQCRGGSTPVDVRTDVYALGVVLYRLLCGAAPFALSDLPVAEALRIVQEKEPKRPSSRVPALRGDLEAIVTTAMSKRPEDRYASAAALADDLRRWLGSRPVDARPPSALRQLRLFGARHRALVATIALLAFSLIAGTIASTVFALRAGEEAERRAIAEEQATVERDVALRQSYVANLAAASAAFDVGEYGRMRSRLESAPIAMRGWEWRLLDAMSEPSDAVVVAHEDMILGFAMDEDGGRIATCAADGSVGVWGLDDAGSPHPIAMHRGHEGRALAIDFAGERIASGGFDGFVHLWDAADGRHLCSMQVTKRSVLSLALVEDGTVFVADGGGALVQCDVFSGAELASIEDGTTSLVGVVASGDGRRIATWSDDGTVVVRDVATGEPLARFDFAGQPRSAALDDAGELVAVGGDEGRIMVWRVVDGAVIAEFGGSFSLVASLAFSHDGTRLVGGYSSDRSIRVWSLVAEDRERTPEIVLRGHEETVSGVAFSTDDRRIHSASWDRALRTWTPDDGGALSTLVGHGDRVLCAAFDSSGAIVASGDLDGWMRFWDAANGAAIGAVKAHDDVIYAIAYAGDGRALATASGDRTVRLWDAATARPIGELEKAPAAVWTVAFSPDGTLVATAGNDGVLRLHDRATREPIAALEGHADRIVRLAFSPDGRLIATASRDHDVRIWDVLERRLLHVLEGHRSDVFDVVFSHDGTRLYSGSRDQTVRVWEVESGAVLATLGGHGQFITCLSLSPDGTRLVGGSWFREILVWDTTTLDSVAAFKGHAMAVRSAAFDRSGRRLATSSLDGTVRLWDATPHAERLAARTVHDSAAAQAAAATGDELDAGAVDAALPSAVRDAFRVERLARSLDDRR
jgi:WD40 repeat protein